jgi:hypothetical protein
MRKALKQTQIRLRRIGRGEGTFALLVRMYASCIAPNYVLPALVTLFALSGETEVKLDTRFIFRQRGRCGDTLNTSTYCLQQILYYNAFGVLLCVLVSAAPCR